MSRAVAILAVRELTARLAGPTDGLQALTARILGSSVLTQTLPLTDVSPFGALPESVGVSSERVGAPDPARRAEMLGASPPTRPTGPSSGEPARTAKTSAPLFSFRRTGTAGAPVSAARATPGTGPGLESATARGGPAAPPRLGGRGAVPSHDGPPARAKGVAGPSIPRPEPPSRQGQLTIELVDALATELLAGPVGEHRAGEATASPIDHPAARVVSRFDAFAAPARHGADDGPPGATPSVDSPAVMLPPGLIHEAVVWSPEPQRRRTRSAPPAIGEGPERAAGRPLASPLAPPASSPLDAETLAALVNDVLAEQARRHGVDLS